jgi:branched-chain amino acid transport system permease protein
MLVQQILNGIVSGSIYTLMALGLTIIFGILNIINFAHGELYMIGAFFALFAYKALGFSFPIAMVFSMATVFILGMLLERVAFRPLRNAGLASIMISALGLSIILQNLALLICGPDAFRFETCYASVSVRFWGLYITAQRILVIVVAIILIVILTLFIQRSKTGKAMRAYSQDPEAASWMGININRLAVLTFGLGASLAAAAGALIGPIFLVYPSMGLEPLVKGLAIVIIGGMGNVPGAIVTGFLIGVLESLTTAYVSSALRDGITFGILILVLILKPSGLLGKYELEKI